MNGSLLISEMNLSTRAVNALCRSGYREINDLLADEMEKLDGAGDHTLIEIAKCLLWYGYRPRWAVKVMSFSNLIFRNARDLDAEGFWKMTNSEGYNELEAWMLYRAIMHLGKSVEWALSKESFGGKQIAYIWRKGGIIIPEEPEESAPEECKISLCQVLTEPAPAPTQTINAAVGSYEKTIEAVRAASEISVNSTPATSLNPSSASELQAL